MADSSAVCTSTLEGCGRPLVFISDLHFDFTEDTYDLDSSQGMIDDFIAFIKANYSDCVLCLAGDYFNGCGHSAGFVQKLEENKIEGFFVLGNRDYWNTDGYTIRDITNMFREGTCNNKYFKFLCTGVKYYVGELCIIGDTGWTSMRIGDKRVSDALLQQTPDATYIGEYTADTVISCHNEWVTYANEVISEEKNTLVITHFPMVSLSDDEASGCWSSTTELNCDGCWCIYGHSVDLLDRKYENHISARRGYGNKSRESLCKWACSVEFGKKYGIDENSGIVSEKQRTAYIAEKYRPYIRKLNKDVEDKHVAAEYRGYKNEYVKTNWASTTPKNQYEFSCGGMYSSDFACLFPLNSVTYGTDYSLSNFSRFYTYGVSVKDNLVSKTQVYSRKYDRCSTNGLNMVSFAIKPKEYVEKLSRMVDNYISKNVRMGYVFDRYMLPESILALRSSVDILNSDICDDRLRILSFVVSSYAYNETPALLAGMTPLDDYDIFRYWLLYHTCLEFCTENVVAVEVVESKMESVLFNGVHIKLPRVNGMELKSSDVKCLVEASVFNGL